MQRNVQNFIKYLKVNISYQVKLTLYLYKQIKSKALYEALLKVGCITRPFPTGVRITVGFPEQNDKMIDVLQQFKF